MRELRDFILDYTFCDEEKEIRFFKEEKPKFLQEFIYYEEVFYIESNLPVGGSELQKTYLQHNLDRIGIIFLRNG